MRHLKTHSGEKPNKCNQCDYASAPAGNLRRHLKTHSGEKSNKCNQCDYASSRADSLRTHLKMHSGEKANKCNQCDYASSHASNLMQHLKTHSGEKSNKCNQCDYASSEVGDLRQHLKTHSGEEPNRCGVTLPALTQVLWGDTRRSTNQFRKEKTVYLSSWVDPQRTRIKVKINLASYNSNLWNKYQQLHFWKEKHRQRHNLLILFCLTRIVDSWLFKDKNSWFYSNRESTFWMANDILEMPNPILLIRNNKINKMG